MRGQPYPIGLLMFMIASVLLHSCGGTEAYYDVVVVGGGAGGHTIGPLRGISADCRGNSLAWWHAHIRGSLGV